MIKKKKQHPSTENYWQKGSVNTTNSNTPWEMKVSPTYSRVETVMSQLLSQLSHSVCAYVSY